MQARLGAVKVYQVSMANLPCVLTDMNVYWWQ